jgi:HTH-type transcriptional regulator, glycine betaine synthesis regulator
LGCFPQDRIDRDEVSLQAKQTGSGSPDFSHALQSAGRRELVEAGGGLFQALGLPRSTGQIYGLLYLSDGPLALDDIVRILSISKGSASIGTRCLTGWGAVRQVWIPGDRRDHFEAADDLAEILRASFSEFLKPRLASSERRLARISEALEEDLARGVLSKDGYRFCAERLRTLLRYQKKVQSIGPLAEKLLL